MLVLLLMMMRVIHRKFFFPELEPDAALKIRRNNLRVRSGVVVVVAVVTQLVGQVFGTVQRRRSLSAGI